MMTPDQLQGLGQIVGTIALAILSAVGGYKARGGGKKASRGADVIAVAQRRCPDHTEYAIVISQLPEMRKEFRAFGKKQDQLFDQVFTILRSHEGQLGELRGAVGLIETETKEPHP
jgi:hypothetical protein